MLPKRPTSALADDDAIGTLVVVEHDGARLGATAIELRYDAHGLLELPPKRGRAQDELYACTADDERKGAIIRHVNLLER